MTTELAPPDCRHCRHSQGSHCLKNEGTTYWARHPISFWLSAGVDICGPEGRHFAVASFPVLEARGLAGTKAKP